MHVISLCEDYMPGAIDVERLLVEQPPNVPAILNAILHLGAITSASPDQQLVIIEKIEQLRLRIPSPVEVV